MLIVLMRFLPWLVTIKLGSESGNSKDIDLKIDAICHDSLHVN